ncbi:hypothetical protein PV325_011933 [Microctonus aethiopoides]|nr:hypothetical protein PV325_011933 [Microctonus aethiopoides]KAK0094923.1 hypothetical protein PV326_009608 [Microctonus aethiopoides]
MPVEVRAHLSDGGANNDGDLKSHWIYHQQQDEKSKSRPVSYYDNFKDTSSIPSCIASTMSVGNLNQIATSTASRLLDNNNCSNNIEGDNERYRDSDRAPSMANSLSTTVPVNLAASQISGRHTPTRSSLRHSRMIVMHRHGTIPRKSRLPLLRRHKLAQSLAILQTIFGIIITSMSLCLLLWAPNLPFMDNPYWSGMPLFLSGSFGICILCCFKKEYPGMNPGFCRTSTKIISILLVILAIITSVIAFVSSTVHLIKLSGLECSPPRVRNATCACRIRSEIASPSEPVLKYIDLSCPEVEGIFTILLIFSAACNAFGTFIAGWYCYLHWCTNDKRPKYIKVRTGTRSMTNGLISRPIYNPNLNER